MLPKRAIIFELLFENNENKETLIDFLKSFLTLIFVMQLKSGGEYDTLKKTVSIAISNFDILKNRQGYHHVFHLCEPSTGIKFTDIIEINTVELSKIPIESNGTKNTNRRCF